jgi:hypothetical protein
MHASTPPSSSRGQDTSVSIHQLADTIPAPPPVHSRYVAICGCERTFSLWQWEELHFVGFQANDEGVELRNCVCGSTIGRGVAS